MTKLELAIAGAILQQATAMDGNEVAFSVELEQGKMAYAIEGTMHFERHNEVNGEYGGMSDLTQVIDSVCCEIDSALAFDENDDYQEIDMSNIIDYVERKSA